jgi:hypothetical protein
MVMPLPIKQDIVGRKFGKLTVLNDYIKIKNGTKWKCLCECGNEVYVYRGKLITGHTKSCGCLTKKYNGLSKHKLYSIWSNIKDRCYNKNNHAYSNYGGKGVKMCEEWHDFMNFYNWSIANGYKEGLTIDRIDPNGDYSPENCKWVTLSENVARANKYTHRRKTKYLYYGISPNGKKYIFNNANKFAREHNLNANGIRRVANGQRKTHKGWMFGFTNIPNI